MGERGELSQALLIYRPFPFLFLHPSLFVMSRSLLNDTPEPGAMSPGSLAPSFAGPRRRRHRVTGGGVDGWCMLIAVPLVQMPHGCRSRGMTAMRSCAGRLGV